MTLFNDPFFCTFTLNVQKKKIFCSPFVLAKQSEYFKALISGPYSDASVVNFEDDEYEVLFKLMEYLHSSSKILKKIDLNETLIMYELADRLMLDGNVMATIRTNLMKRPFEKEDLQDLLCFYSKFGVKIKNVKFLKNFSFKISEVFYKINNIDDEIFKDFDKEDFKALLSIKLITFKGSPKFYMCRKCNVKFISELSYSEHECGDIKGWGTGHECGNWWIESGNWGI